jgi:TRAP-type C4-dicarboxylate transport system permease small subunit
LGPSHQPSETPLADALDGLVRWIGRLVSWANAALIGVIMLQVVLRYGFGRGLVLL